MPYVIYLILILVSNYASFHIGRSYEKVELEHKSSHDLCFDTKKWESFVARKGNEVRCFQLQREWPHRARSSLIE